MRLDGTWHNLVEGKFQWTESLPLWYTEKYGRRRELYKYIWPYLLKYLDLRSDVWDSMNSYWSIHQFQVTLFKVALPQGSKPNKQTKWGYKLNTTQCLQKRIYFISLYCLFIWILLYIFLNFINTKVFIFPEILSICVYVLKVVVDRIINSVSCIYILRSNHFWKVYSGRRKL